MNKSVSSFLRSCQNLKALKTIHAHLLTDGSLFSSEVALNKLLRFYYHFGALDHARNLFDEIPQPNSFHWTALIHAHVHHHLDHHALLLFHLMLTSSSSPLPFTLASALKASARLSQIQFSKSLHSLASKSGLVSDTTVHNSLISTYSRCGDVENARKVFDEMPVTDIVSWNSMIFGYCKRGLISDARDLFGKMPERNVVSLTTMISGFATAGDMAAARALFEQMSFRDPASWNVIISGYVNANDVTTAFHLFEEMPEVNIGSWNVMISGFCRAGDMNSARELFNRMPGKNVMSWTTIVDGYVKIGDLNSARCLFDQMPEKNLISWSVMIAGYVKKGQPKFALELLKQFKETGIEPDEPFNLSIISTCAHLGVLHTAKLIVRDYVENVHLSSMQIVTSLIDMYAKCGSIDDALEVFQQTPRKDLICYSTMITALANHGMGQCAITLFNEMLQSGLEPDRVAFVGVLSACTHGGLVNEGKMFFKMMIEEFNIAPSDKHYACMVDLLGRAGHLEEAYQLARAMSTKPSSTIWGALLGACKVHQNVNLAEVAANHLFKIEPDNSGNYILLSNLYASVERWEDVAKIRTMMREQKIRKNRGSSWIELDCVVHEFVMGDTSHFDTDSIYAALDLLVEDIKNYGYLVKFGTGDIVICI